MTNPQELPPRPPVHEKPGGRTDLVRYGVTWNGEKNTPLLTPMPDGYWTPWHLAAHSAPEAVGAEDEELMATFWEGAGLANAGTGAHILRGLRAVLSRYGTAHPAPVPAGERLPKEEEMKNGQCWWFNPGVAASSNPHIAFSGWKLTSMLAGKPMGTHWAPWWAFPEPEPKA